MGTVDGIVVAFAIPTWLDQSCDSEQCQVVTDRRLTLARELAQSRHVHFGPARQFQQDPKSRFVGQEFEELEQVVLQLFGKLAARGNRVVPSGIASDHRKTLL